MRVWWCEVHDDRPISFADIPECESRFQPVGPHWRDPCRMVEMQLVPADALVIQKVNSEWPTLLIMELADLLAFERGDETVEYHEARRFLDSLLVASVSKAAT